MKSGSENPSKLIDNELINLLKICQEMYDKFKNNNDNY